MRGLKYNHISEVRLVDYVLGNLSENEKIEIEQHLFTCEQCFDEWHGWQEVMRENEEEYSPTPLLKHRITEEIEKTVNKRKRPWMSKPAYAMIGVCLLFIAWLTVYPLSGSDENTSLKGIDRTVHPYPFDQEEIALDVSELEAFNSFPATNLTNMIWIHNIENRPIVYVNHQGPEQLLDCQYIVVIKKQDWGKPALFIQNHSEIQLKEQENIYLRCVR